MTARNRIGGDWDDDRVDAAFAARASTTPATPPDLASQVAEQLDRADRRSVRWPWPAAATAAVAMIVVVVGSSLGDRPKPTPSDAQAAASGQPSNPAATDAVLAALGGPISVSEALKVRDSEINQREIIVGGFLSPVPDGVPCPAIAYLTENPTQLRCPQTYEWVTQQPEPSPTADDGPVEFQPPAGPAFKPSFALVSPRAGGLAPTVEQGPAAVVLMGHFHDRRAQLCGDDRATCEQTFVVDRVLAIEGVERPVETRGSSDGQPIDTESDVDGLVAVAAPTAVVVSRQLLSVGAAQQVEPALRADSFIPYVDQQQLAWIVTTVDRIDDVPVARTFMLLDGSDWFAEIAAGVTRRYERIEPEPTFIPGAPGPTAEPDAFVAAPSDVFGIRVGTVADVNRTRQNPDHRQYREEYAVRGWYIAPRPGVACDPPMLEIRPPDPPCDEARHWLLHDPQQYGISEGQRRSDPNVPPWVLNPILPIDVPFDVDSTWRGDVPVPQPVIVLGHFADTRVAPGKDSDLYFTIDALVWSRSDRVPDRVVRLTDLAADDPAAAVGRVAAISGEEPLATWITVVSAADFRRLEANAAALEAIELGGGSPVWIVRRLILEEHELAPRYSVETGYTMNQGTRVWHAPNLDSSARLATSLDLSESDANTDLIQAFDYSAGIEAIRPATNLGPLAWQRVDGMPYVMDIARGASTHEVVLRWRAPACQRTWHLEARANSEATSLDLYPVEDCSGEEVTRRLVIRFYRVHDIDKFDSGFCCG